MDFLALAVLQIIQTGSESSHSNVVGVPLGDSVLELRDFFFTQSCKGQDKL